MFIAASSNPASASRTMPARLKGRAPWKSVSELPFGPGVGTAWAPSVTTGWLLAERALFATVQPGIHAVCFRGSSPLGDHYSGITDINRGQMRAPIAARLRKHEKNP